MTDEYFAQKMSQPAFSLGDAESVAAFEHAQVVYNKEYNVRFDDDYPTSLLSIASRKNRSLP